MSVIKQLRQTFHQSVCQNVIFYKNGDIPSMADVGSELSITLARNILQQIDVPVSSQPIAGQTAGKRFEETVRDFLQDSFDLLTHLRPGPWIFSTQGKISDFAQFKHLAELADLVKSSPALHTVLGDYVVKPDVVVSRQPVSDDQINQNQHLVDTDDLPRYTPLRQANVSFSTQILHASISCKLTIRSDRSQNARTEGLNLIRNRKGHTPHIVAVTAEPLPSRIASLALGTGDIDCEI